jgi:diadenylate cyclase
VLEWLTTAIRRPPMTWWDILDIAIVALVIYESLKLIRGTRAVQMAAGSLLILLLLFVSRLFPLQTVNWLIRNLLVYVGFAAIVIFQSDIRRALAHLDTGDEAIEEIVSASAMLAANKTGAIIAIEREIGLRNYIESGIPIDGEVTHDLLVTVFQLGAPLHDGAVMIQEGRVAAAACFLPLTVNPVFGRELGTRHRAAIGLTEESDAIAVVVSEETGKISIALDGQLERDLNADQLRARLAALVLQRRAPARAPSAAYEI